MMTAQTVQDNVNKYRYGVLIGNSTEERFGIDAGQRSRNERFPISTQKDHFSLANTALNLIKPNITEQETEFNNHVKFSNRGVQNHILVGHGVRDEHFQNKYRGTNYDLSYNQKIHTKTQVWSKFDANPQTTQRPFHKDLQYEKEYQKQIPEMGTKVQRTQKPFKPYAEYTKTYDATHFKIPLRK